MAKGFAQLAASSRAGQCGEGSARYFLMIGVPGTF